MMAAWETEIAILGRGAVGGISKMEIASREGPGSRAGVLQGSMWLGMAAPAQ
jgi:hypothetical protein